MEAFKFIRTERFQRECVRVYDVSLTPRGRLIQVYIEPPMSIKQMAIAMEEADILVRCLCGPAAPSKKEWSL